MGWKQAGYGIFPFAGTKAPHINVGYDGNKTILIVTIDEKVEGKKLEDYCKVIYQEGKDILNPPIIDNREAKTFSTENLTLEYLLNINAELQQSFLRQFCGVRVRKDFTLKANEWYCAVSPEILKQLKALKGK